MTMMKSPRLTTVCLFVIFCCTGAFQVFPSAPQNVRLTSLHATNGLKEGGVTDRRDALKASSVILLSFLLGEESAKAADPKTILITGSNSGIGFEAAKLLAEKGHNIILACRTLAKAEDAARRIEAETTAGTLFPAECNLASLDSIKSFVQSMKVNKLDVMCLNAGLSLDVNDKQIQRTADGFELTVGTNHLGHFFLAHLLLWGGRSGDNSIVKRPDRIVITASGVHDPESPGGAQGRTATIGNMEGFERDGRNFEMVSGEPYDGDKAYKDSKVSPYLIKIGPLLIYMHLSSLPPSVALNNVRVAL